MRDEKQPTESGNRERDDSDVPTQKRVTITLAEEKKKRFGAGI